MTAQAFTAASSKTAPRAPGRAKLILAAILIIGVFIALLLRQVVIPEDGRAATRE